MSESAPDSSHMLGFSFFEGVALCPELLDLTGAGDERGSGMSDSTDDSASFAATPKKLATASQDVFSRDFSAFGFSSEAKS
ncbi:MAG: hypothetical protein ACK6A7_20740 [Planctomycetota bacterium]